MNKLELFSKLYEEAALAAEGAHSKFRRCREQYQGDLRIDGAALGSERASFCRNITYEIIESQISTDIPAARVNESRHSERNLRLAACIERLCNRVRDRADYERINDLAERDALTLGVSVYRLDWDESLRTHDTSGDVSVSLVDPCDFFPQPDRASISDMDYCFIRSRTTMGDVRARYALNDGSYSPVHAAISANSANNAPALSVDENDLSHPVAVVSADKKAIHAPLEAPESATCAALSSLLLGANDSTPVEVITCYYYNDLRQLSRFVFCEDHVLEDIENYYSRKRRICTVCGMPEDTCVCPEDCRSPDRFALVDEPFETLSRDIVIDRGGSDERVISALGGSSAGGLLSSSAETSDSAPTVLPWYAPSRIPVVIRTNISSPDRWYGQSDCDFIRPYQQEINKIESRIHEKLMRSSVIPVLPAESEFRLDNSINSRVLRLREGEDKGMYGTISTQADIAQDIEAAERVYQMAKRCMGISDSFQGYADDTALSGRAKEIQVAQSAGRMASKRVMKQAAFAEMDRIIFEMYLAFSDEPRPLTYVDAFGRTQNDAFNRYAFLERDLSTGGYYYNDDFLFSCDDGSDSALSRETLWETVISHFREGIFGDPSNNAAILRLWQSLERLHHPLGRFNVEYFSALTKT